MVPPVSAASIRLAVLPPAALGENDTVMSQVCPGAIVLQALLSSANSEAFAPMIVAEICPDVDAPVFETVNVAGALVAPTTTDPNGLLSGETLSTAGSAGA